MYIYIARQPIFNTAKTVTAYELLYRSSEINAFDSGINGDKATRRLLSQALLDFGIQTIAAQKKAYVNFTGPLLMAGLPLMLDKSMFVVEVLEDVDLNRDIVRRLKDYRDHGYVLALDDYSGEPLDDSALECMDIIKIDFLKTTPQTRAVIAREMLKKRKTLLAEKVETEEDFAEALALGCRLFQGYYLSKPLLLKKKAANISQTSSVRLFRQLSDEVYNTDTLAEDIRVDAHLTYKLLQKMRTARYYRGQVVHSIKDALIRMGMDEVRRWISLILMQDLTETTSDEQVRLALVRAIFCEKMAGGTKNRTLAGEAFITGIFSIIEAEKGEFQDLLMLLDVTRQVRDALLDRTPNDLTHFLNTAMLYESHQWDQLFAQYSQKELWELQTYYMEAVKYADSALKDS